VEEGTDGSCLRASRRYHTSRTGRDCSLRARKPLLWTLCSASTETCVGGGRKVRGSAVGSSL